MEDYRLDRSGQEVQDILDNAVLQSDLTAETERATEAEQTLQDNIDAEATRAQGAEGTLQDNIDAEETRAKAAEKQNADDIDAIEEKIPSGASTLNKLATEEYVADAVATATATFRGTYNLVSDLHLNVTATEQQISAALAGAISTADNNDYCFILVPTSLETPTEIKEIDRYKFNGTAWAFEYKLNNSGFTAAQWAAINSGITSGDVAKLAALPTNAQLTTLLAGLQSDIDGEETRAKGAEGTLQDNIDAEETRAKAAEKQNADDIDAIEAVIPESASSENKVATESEINSLSAAIEAILLLIPSAATSLNKLADKAFVNSSIATATATFRGTYNLVNDLGLTTSATHAQIATALAGAILTADNNDYAFVQIPTSDAMPTEIAKTERYKFNGTAWEYEYDLNNSGFTADQWAAINSGITQALVTKLSALPTNAELTTELGTLTSGINTINQKIPNAASQANKLVDTAAMESYIVQVLDVLTASFNVTSTDGHVTVQISQVDGKITSVAVSTSDIASAADLNLKASQADLTALASRVTTAEGNITTLGGRITTAEGNITSLGGRMTTAEGNITTINGIITSLGGRVSTNETDIANLQELYNSLQQSKPVPVDALPETGQQQGVIYRLSGTTSYSDYMWNGSTWVLMATYNNAIDPSPKKASQNLVTSGGVFDNMGALDVSELNATENPHTLAQYTDLSAALAAIPTDYQKGGMSIKFVQSSDNKYVQYRYMGTAVTGTPNPFLDTANWQGVDDGPTAGSENLVKSGGVYEAINSINYNDITSSNAVFKGVSATGSIADQTTREISTTTATNRVLIGPFVFMHDTEISIDDGYRYIIYYLFPDDTERYSQMHNTWQTGKHIIGVHPRYRNQTLYYIMISRPDNGNMNDLPACAYKSMIHLKNVDGENPLHIIFCDSWTSTGSPKGFDSISQNIYQRVWFEVEPEGNKYCYFGNSTLIFSAMNKGQEILSNAYRPFILPEYKPTKFLIRKNASYSTEFRDCTSFEQLYSIIGFNKESYDFKRLEGINVYADKNALLAGDTLLSEISNGLIIEGDNIGYSHTPSLKFYDGKAYLSMTADPSNSELTNQTAIIVSEIDVVQSQIIQNHVIASVGTYGGITFDGACTNSYSYIVSNILHIVYNAHIDGGVYLAHCSFNLDTKAFVNEICSIEHGTDTEDFNNANLKALFGAEYGIKDYGYEIVASQIATDGTYYYAAISSGNFVDGKTPIMYTSDFSTWKLFTVPDIKYGSDCEIAIIINNGYLYGASRHYYGDCTLCIWKMNLSTKEIVDSVQIEDCATRPTFFLKDGSIFLAHGLDSRNVLQILRISGSRLAQSSCYLECSDSGILGYNSFENLEGVTYIAIQKGISGFNSPRNVIAQVLVI